VFGAFVGFCPAIWISTLEDKATDIACEAFGDPSIADGGEENGGSFG
jgi:hypothetical protein